MIIELFTICQLNSCPEVDMTAIKEAESYLEHILPEYWGETTFRIHQVPYYSDKAYFTGEDMTYYANKIRDEYNIEYFDWGTYEGTMVGLLVDNAYPLGMADVFERTNTFFFRNSEHFDDSDTNTRDTAATIAHEVLHLMNLKHTCKPNRDYLNWIRNPGTWLINSIWEWKAYYECVDDSSDYMMNNYACTDYTYGLIPIKDCKVDVMHQFTDYEWERYTADPDKHVHRGAEGFEKLKNFVKNLFE